MIFNRSMIWSTLFISVFFLCSCGKQEHKTIQEKIAKNWQLSKITENNIDSRIPIDSLDVLNIIYGEEQRFEFILKDKNISRQGYWQVAHDSLLYLTYDLTDTIVSIDSITYRTVKGETGLDIFSKGTKLAHFNNKLSGIPEVGILEIVDLSDNTLTIGYKNKEYHYEYEELAPVLSFNLRSFIRGAIGMLIVIFIAYLFSSNRKAISWRIVAIGLSAQIILAIGVLKVPFVQKIFESISSFFIVILDFTREGSIFLLGDLMNVNTYGFIFAFQVLPTIIFFSALTSVLFYLGVIQKIVYALAWLMTKLMRLSGAESLSVAGNIFLGQTESPLMIKAYLPKMNKSEILLVMIGGMATIAGGVLAAYISFLGGDDPVMRLYFAKHLLTASVMAAPGAVVASKILMPQTEEINKKVEITQDKIGSNFLEAIANGTAEGLKLAVNVAAMLLVFIAFIAMANYILSDFIGSNTGLNNVISEMTNGQYKALNLQFVLGYIFAPLMWAIGVPIEDMTLAGRLLGEKIIMSEFIAYISLAELKDTFQFTHEKSIIMATYMLCGFANFASIGIQIGGIGSLAPNQRKRLSEFGIKALIGGTIASLFSATVVGMLM